MIKYLLVVSLVVMLPGCMPPDEDNNWKSCAMPQNCPARDCPEMVKITNSPEEEPARKPLKFDDLPWPNNTQ